MMRYYTILLLNREANQNVGHWYNICVQSRIETFSNSYLTTLLHLFFHALKENRYLRFIKRFQFLTRAKYCLVVMCSFKLY